MHLLRSTPLQISQEPRIPDKPPLSRQPHICTLKSIRADFIILCSWANQICADDYQERAVVLASMK